MRHACLSDYIIARHLHISSWKLVFGGIVLLPATELNDELFPYYVLLGYLTQKCDYSESNSSSALRNIKFGATIPGLTARQVLFKLSEARCMMDISSRICIITLCFGTGERFLIRCCDWGRDGAHCRLRMSFRLITWKRSLGGGSLGSIKVF